MWLAPESDWWVVRDGVVVGLAAGWGWWAVTGIRGWVAGRKRRGRHEHMRAMDRLKEMDR